MGLFLFSSFHKTCRRDLEHLMSLWKRWYSLGQHRIIQYGVPPLLHLSQGESAGKFHPKMHRCQIICLEINRWIGDFFIFGWSWRFGQMMSWVFFFFFCWTASTRHQPNEKSRSSVRHKGRATTCWTLVISMRSSWGFHLPRSLVDAAAGGSWKQKSILHLRSVPFVPFSRHPFWIFVCLFVFPLFTVFNHLPEHLNSLMIFPFSWNAI